MRYVKKESYRFACPREFKAYLAFKDKLRDADIRFLDEGGTMEQTITITTNATIDVNENADFLVLGKEQI